MYIVIIYNIYIYIYIFSSNLVCDILHICISIDGVNKY